MDWRDWRPTYEAILEDFGWDPAADRASAAALAPLVQGRWLHVGTELKHRDVVVVGCSEALDTLQTVPPGVVVAADGATARLREIGVVPRVVVTDLDGSPDALQWAAQQGSTMVIHAHGANQDALSMASTLGPLTVGTCQCDPTGLEPLRNLGGFTDGDRAVLLAEAYQARSITLVAFDLDAPTSRHSHRFDPATKAKKLGWARRILEGVAARGTPLTW